MSAPEVRTPDEILAPVPTTKQVLSNVATGLWAAFQGATTIVLLENSDALLHVAKGSLPLWAYGVVAAAGVIIKRVLKSRTEGQHRQEVLEALKTEPPSDIRKYF